MPANVIEIQSRSSGDVGENVRLEVPESNAFHALKLVSDLRDDERHRDAGVSVKVEAFDADLFERMRIDEDARELDRLKD